MDQATRLRQLINVKNSLDKNRFRVITVSSGKGGVGKTNFVTNIAMSLAKRGVRVGILDADFGMANIDILFGVKSRYSIYDILYNNKTIDDVGIITNHGIKIIPGGSGINELYEIDDDKRKKLMNEFSKLQNIDILLVDTGAGISKTVLNFVEIADEVIVITNAEPTALTDAYGLIKVIINKNINSNINVVINRARNIKEARDTFEKLFKTVETFLSAKIKYQGFVIEDLKVSQAVREQKPFYELYPKCEASLCIQRITSEILGENQPVKNDSIKEYIGKLLRVMGR
jgi:flagellar biosynthesis protein FlhG